MWKRSSVIAPIMKFKKSLLKYHSVENKFLQYSSYVLITRKRGQPGAMFYSGICFMVFYVT